MFTLSTGEKAEGSHSGCRLECKELQAIVILWLVGWAGWLVDWLAGLAG